MIGPHCYRKWPGSFSLLKSYSSKTSHQSSQTTKTYSFIFCILKLFFHPISWLCSHFPHPLHFPMDSLTKCSSVLGALTLGTVLRAISTRLLLTRESIPSLMTMIFKEEMKSHHHSSRPLKNLGFLFLCFLSTMPLQNFAWTNLFTLFIVTRQRVASSCLFSLVRILLMCAIIQVAMVKHWLSMKKGFKMIRITWRGWSDGKWL